MRELSTTFVDKYLQRIRENRELKNATTLTSTEGKLELDASKIIFIPSSIEGTMAIEITEGNNTLNYDYSTDETVMEVVSRKNAFTLNCVIVEGMSDVHIYTSLNLSCTYDDYNPAAQKGVYVPLIRKEEERIIILSDLIVNE